MKKTFLRLPLLYLALILCATNHAQNIGINDDDSNPDASAMLDVKSTNKGMLIPRMTSAQRGIISSPALGLLVFDTDTESFWFNQSTGWVELATDAGVATGNNTFVGTDAGSNNINGSHNTEIGYRAGYKERGSDNTYVGSQAGGGNANANRTGNVFIGREAGKDETGDNKLYIENTDSATPLIYGEFDSDLLRINGTLDINDAYSLPNTDGNTNEVLTTDGNGNVAWRGSDGVPIGTILPYGGDVPPAGYLECDGSSVTMADYTALFGAIGTRWGGNGSPNFNLPDLRGQFLRGWDHGAGVDPDVSTRFALNGSSIGDNVGSYQDSEFKEHHHGNQDKSITGTSTNPSAAAGISHGTGKTSYVQTRGGAESRPKNAYVMYIIKAIN